MKNRQTEASVLWVQVFGIATLHGAISITWLIYNLYLPELLTQFGFSVALVQLILIVENLIAAVVEPAAGAASDQAANRWRGRLAIISGGAYTAAATFILVPLVALIATPTGIARWLIPMFLTLWAFAMATFRSPSLALLKSAASSKNLPQAAVFLTILTALFAAIRPFATNFILSLGPLAAFTIGSVGLLLGTIVLRRLFPSTSTNTPSSSQPEVEQFSLNLNLDRLRSYRFPLLLVFGIGLSGAWSFRLTTTALTTMLAVPFPNQDTVWLMSIFFFLLALAALPLSNIATRFGNRQTMLIGTAVAAVAFGLTALWPTPLLYPITILCAIIGLSILTTGAVPFALEIMPSHWNGLSVGVQFAGFTLATSLFYIFADPITTSPTLVLPSFATALAFALSALCVILSRTIVADLTQH